jgi:hypothetical protein
MDEDERHKEFLLQALRAASLRAKLMDNELQSIGVALKNNLIGPDTAIKWAYDMGIMFLIDPVPGAVGAIALQNTSPPAEGNGNAA